MASFDDVLAACLSHDNNVRRQAEAALKPALARPEAVPELAARLQSAADAQVRQLSAVLLRKSLPRHWRALAAPLKTGVQQLLLERLAAEPEHFVRRAVADAVAAVARLALPAWQKPLMGFLQQCSASPSPEHREVAMLLFASLCEAAPEHLAAHAAAVQAAVAAGLADAGATGAAAPNAPATTNARAGAAVRAAALAAVEPVLGLVDSKRAAEGFRRTVLPALLQLLRAQVQRQDDESELARALQALVEVVEAAEHRPGVLPVAGGALQAALEVAMAAASERALDADLREQALMVVHAAARSRPRALGRQLPLTHALVTALCAVAAEPLPDDHEDDGAGEMPPCRAAAQALDVLALELPTEAVFPPAWAFVVRAAPAHGGADPAAAATAAAARAGAMNVLAVLCEGCADELRPRLAEALPLLLACLGDAQSADVRGAAAFALGQAAEHLQPEISSHECYALVLPRVFELLALDATPQVRERACYALNALCERLEADEIAPYVPSLVQQLVSVLQQSQGQPAVQEMALTALSTTAGSAGAAFAPHVQAVLPVLDHFMSGAAPPTTSSGGGGSCVSARDAVGPRCRATECAGIVVEAVCGAGGGGDGLAPAAPRDPAMMAALPRLMEAALRGFEVASQLDAKARALQQQQLRAFEAAMARPEGQNGGGDDDDDDDDDDEADGEDEADGASELREFAHGFFERVAATLGADFAPWIPRVAPLALASVRRDDGAGAGAGAAAAAAAAAGAGARAGPGAAPGGSADPTPSGSQSVRGEEDDEDADDEDDDDEDAAARRAMGVRTGLLDEMVAATGALSAYAESCPQAFAPAFAEACLAALKDVMYHTHEELRAAAAPAIKSLVVAVHVAAGGRRADEAGAQGAQGAAAAGPVVPPASVAVAAAALPLLLAPIEEEPDVDATVAATSALAGILRALPLAALGPASLEAASKAAAALLAGDALCQNELADSDEEDEDADGGRAGADAHATVTAPGGGGGHKAAGAAEEDDDEDGGGGRGLGDGEEDALVSAAGEVLSALCGALGAEAFAGVFQAAHLEPLLARLAQDQPSGVRAAAAGVVSELAQLLGGGGGGGAAGGAAAAAAASALAHRALPLVLDDLRPDGAAPAATATAAGAGAAAIDPPDATNRQNAAFAVGALAECCPAAAAQHAARALLALHPHFAPLAALPAGAAPAAVDEPSVLDNAAGAVGRLVAALGGDMPQLEQVLPLLARALPLREDLGETTPAVRALATALTTPALAARASGAAADGVRALAAVAAQRAAPEEARVMAAAALAQLHKQHPEQVGPMLSALPQEHQEAVRAMAAAAGAGV